MDLTALDKLTQQQCGFAALPGNNTYGGWSRNGKLSTHRIVTEIIDIQVRISTFAERLW